VYLSEASGESGEDCVNVSIVTPHVTKTLIKVINRRNLKIKFQIQIIVKSIRISFSSGIQNSNLPLMKIDFFWH
jgi:hypothetical protein